MHFSRQYGINSARRLAPARTSNADGAARGPNPGGIILQWLCLYMPWGQDRALEVRAEAVSVLTLFRRHLRSRVRLPARTCPFRPPVFEVSSRCRFQRTPQAVKIVLGSTDTTHSFQLKVRLYRHPKHAFYRRWNRLVLLTPNALFRVATTLNVCSGPKTVNERTFNVPRTRKSLLHFRQGGEVACD